MEKKLLSVRIHTMGNTTVKKNGRTYKGIVDQKAHNTRTETMEADYLLRPEHSGNNIHHTETDEAGIFSKLELAAEHYQNRYKRKLPKTTKPYIDGLITFSDTMFQDLIIDKKFSINEMSDTVVEFLRQEFGESFVAMDLHADETTPHFHFTAVNYDFEKGLTYSSSMRRDIKSNQKNELQDRFANFMQSKINGFDYERGEIHSIKEYHNKRKSQQIHISKQSDQIKEQSLEIEKLKSSIKAFEVSLVDKTQEAERLSARIEDLEAVADNLEVEVIRDIRIVINDLIEIDKTLDAQKFIQRVSRYAKSDSKEKLNKIIAKWNKQHTRVKSRNLNR